MPTNRSPGSADGAGSPSSSGAPACISGRSPGASPSTSCRPIPPSAHGLAALVSRLESKAPVLASTVDRRNPRRVVRALELALLRGDQSRPAAIGYGGSVLWLGLSLTPVTNRTWIADRARAQFASGLLEEAAALRRRWDPSLPAFSAIGYREAWAVLDGQLDLESAIELDAHRNNAFARRQRTWFRREPDIAWLDAAADPDRPARAAIRRFLDERLS
jgi:tRNA dimethylallyltransferase